MPERAYLETPRMARRLKSNPSRQRWSGQFDDRRIRKKHGEIS